MAADPGDDYDVSALLRRVEDIFTEIQGKCASAVRGDVPAEQVVSEIPEIIQRRWGRGGRREEGR